MTAPPFIVLEKEIGQTPLQVIETWKTSHPEYANVPASYAGRLDPMASGKLLVLLGDECKKLKHYTGLDKEYRIEVVFGIGTDTGDALGMPQTAGTNVEITESQLRKVVRAALGSHSVPYPAFSSKTVNGTPLFQYALEGTLDTISVPEHIETIYGIKVGTLETVSAADLRERIREHLSKAPRTNDPLKRLGADFRQDAIREHWDELFDQYPDALFCIAELAVVCASGTYMRTLAERLGSALGTDAFTLSIHRSKIGRYMKIGPLGMWTRRF